MHKGLALFCGTGWLLASCGGDQPLTPDEGTSSGGPSTTDDPDSGQEEEEGETVEPADSSTTQDENTSTGPTTSCGNDLIDDTETCDGVDLGGQDCTTQGFDGGTLACATDCTAFDTSACSSNNCGNGAIDGSEVCDGTELGGASCASEGFGSGTLACAKNCAGFDTSGCGGCGNGMIDGDEACDNSLGGESCVGLGFDSGSLDCAADCTFDTSGCGTCGNGAIDGAEFCDGDNLDGMDCAAFAYESGTLACANNCTAFNFSGCGICGNGVTDGDEFCDGTSTGNETCITQGFDSGTLGCNAGCGSFITTGCGTCGDGILTTEEVCDTDQFDGETCASLGLTGGDLACSPSCAYDITDCDVPGIPFGNDTGYNGYWLAEAVVPCDDIAATGTATLLSDDSQIEVGMGFTFPFYDVDYDLVTIESNGMLHFGGDEYISYTNSCLPTATMPDLNNIYVFWDDLNPGTGVGEVYYETLGTPGEQRFVVQWDTAHFGGDGMDFIRLQTVFLEATGQILVCYPDTLSAGNIGDNGAEATSGIQQNSLNGFDFSCNTPDLVNGLQLIYVPIP